MTISLSHLQQVAEAASPGEGQSAYTHPRDANNWQNNEVFVRTFDRPTVEELLRIAIAAKGLCPRRGSWNGGKLSALYEALEGVEL